MSATVDRAEIATVPVRGVEAGAVVLAWRSDDADPVVTAFVSAACDMLERP